MISHIKREGLLPLTVTLDPHSCTDGHGAALLELLRVKCVVKGHLHTKLFEQISPCWLSAGNLMVRRSLLLKAAPSLLLLSDLDHV